MINFTLGFLFACGLMLINIYAKQDTVIKSKLPKKKPKATIIKAKDTSEEKIKFLKNILK